MARRAEAAVSSAPVVGLGSRTMAIAGLLFGALTLIFFMALVVMAILGFAPPANARFLVVEVLALGTALSGAFLGGNAAAKGSLPLPFLNAHPLQFTVAGGIAAFIIISLLGNFLYSAKSNPDLPSGNAILQDGMLNSERSGYSFDSGAVVGWYSKAADLHVTTNPAKPGPLQFFIQHDVEPYTNPEADDLAFGGITEVPGSRLRAVERCPASGYQYFHQDIALRQLYCVLLRDGKRHAVIQVTATYADRMEFEWVLLD
jgi:hypothetical protein